MNEFQNDKIAIQDILISELLDEFLSLYNSHSLSSNEQLDCLEFINTLFKLKHKFILEYNKERRSFSRDTQIYHLKKIQRLAKLRIKKVSKPSSSKKYEPSEEVLQFKNLISALNKKMKQSLTQKTKMLLAELMKERWTVQDKISLLKDILNSKDAKFQDILETQDTEEVITSFLALLDMKRKNEVKVIQERNFGDIIITKKYL